MPNCECYGAGTCRACKAERALNEAGRLREAAEGMAEALRKRIAICRKRWFWKYEVSAPHDEACDGCRDLRDAFAAWERATK